jgi:hypothetical protein
MKLIKLDHEFCVYPFLQVSKFVILLNLHRKENTNTFTFLVVDSALHRVRMVNYPPQGFDAGKN